MLLHLLHGIVCSGSETSELMINKILLLQQAFLGTLTDGTVIGSDVLPFIFAN